MSDALFQALFTYRPVVFQEGDFRFDITSGSLVAAVRGVRSSASSPW